MVNNSAIITDRVCDFIFVYSIINFVTIMTLLGMIISSASLVHMWNALNEILSSQQIQVVRKFLPLLRCIVYN